jgi:hypothetical protein
MFPGASASANLDVTATAITVAMRPSFRGLAWTITTGLRYPGAEPVGADSDAHHSSPRFIGEKLLLRQGQGRIKPRVFLAVEGIE